jgi:hypothetical protein
MNPTMPKTQVVSLCATCVFLKPVGSHAPDIRKCSLPERPNNIIMRHPEETTNFGCIHHKGK